jgi:hypothetical protein
MQQIIDKEHAANTAAALLATEKARAEERRMAQQTREITDEAQRLSARARVESAATADAASRLRERTAAAIGHPVSETAPATTGGETRAAPLDMLADVQQRITEAARQLADYADASHDAGQACERYADAIK